MHISTKNGLSFNLNVQLAPFSHRTLDTLCVEISESNFKDLYFERFQHL